MLKQKKLLGPILGINIERTVVDLKVSVFNLTMKRSTVLVLISMMQFGCINTNLNIAETKTNETITLSFYGPQTSEYDSVNPFLNYLLLVEFNTNGYERIIRGFYAADGNAANSGSDSGAVWQVRYTPEVTGKWSYSAKLYKGDSVAINNNIENAEQIELINSNGKFVVISEKQANDKRFKGRIIAKNGYFKFRNTNEYFLKVGADSPENFLAYSGFDNTFRLEDSKKEGEAETNLEIHSYEPHVKDWNEGDPTWKDGKGKSIIGAVNYLASKGMNSIYFLTFNINGDGKDVWMYTHPDDFTRFDVSKLDQWEIVFQHMQSKGILMHVVLQETENETLLDNGDTGPTRKLYFYELIARFGHHFGLVWNLGEENGPVPWAKDLPYQNDKQRKAMAKFIKETDPYNHPVVLHTLPNEEIRKDIVSNMLGYKYLDGISLQHAERETAPETVSLWKSKADSSGHPWLITMDEIGMWHTGAKTDTADPNHPTLTRYALWGTLLSGASGVEWYFGAHTAQNDLNTENWRLRNQLWEISNHARVFFEKYLPYWEMYPKPELINNQEAYCFCKTNEVYAIYIPNYKSSKINLKEASGEFKVNWYNPFKGGELQTGSVKSLTGSDEVELGNPPSRIGKDWVILLSRIN